MYGTRNIHRIATERQGDERRRAAATRFAVAARDAVQGAAAHGGDITPTPRRRSWFDLPALRRRDATTAVRGAVS
jgi:hypothetical protein